MSVKLETADVSESWKIGMTKTEGDYPAATMKKDRKTIQIEGFIRARPWNC
jgi:hypothetical protein